MEKTVCCVIVTYNRVKLLAGCLAAIQAQTRTPDFVVIVDNGSSDGTGKFVQSQYPEFNYLYLPENLGGAGGFHVGINWAKQCGADSILLMDDDGAPSAECLAKLELCLEDYDIVNALVIVHGSEDDLSFGLNLNGQIHTSVSSLKRDLRGADVLDGEIAPFNGTMIRGDVVDKIGNIKGEMFIWGDEVEYALRAKAAGLRLCTLISARHYHPAAKKSQHHVRGLGTFTLVPLERGHIYYRNFGYISAKYRGAHYVVAKFFAYVVFFIITQQWQNLNIFSKYYWDGVFNIYRFDPPRQRFNQSLRNFEMRSKLEAH